jgi:hypothetical protein
VGEFFGTTVKESPVREQRIVTMVFVKQQLFELEIDYNRLRG